MKQFFVFLFAGLTLVLIQAVSWGQVVPRVVGLNLPLAFVIFLALYCPSVGSWFLAFLLGYALGALSGAPPGLLPLINLAAFSFVRIACKYVLFESLPSQLVLVFALSFSLDLSLLIATKIMFSCPLGLILKRVLAHSLLLTSLSAPPFAFFNKRVPAQGLVLK